jgi:hypothetical protein
VEAVELLCTRKIAAVQYAAALLDRADDIECLNTYATVDRARVSGSPLDPLPHMLVTSAY